MDQHEHENAPDPIPPSAPLQPPAQSPGNYAIASLVLGILAFVACGPCTGVPALIFGMIELQNIKNHRAPVEGRPFALAGAILGGVNSALVVLWIAFSLLVMLLALLGFSGFFN